MVRSFIRNVFSLVKFVILWALLSVVFSVLSYPFVLWILEGESVSSRDLELRSVGLMVFPTPFIGMILSLVVLYILDRPDRDTLA